MSAQATRSTSANVVLLEQVAAPEKTIVRVGAYCRVSTNMDSQKTSIETQMAAYRRIIEEHPGWILAGIYADPGLSGTDILRRPEFLRMMEDARSGNLDCILVKSISRFSRNTVDLLTCVRELRALGIRVFFEKERIDTADIASEFLLSVFAAAAQEETISISENMKVGIRMRYAQGKQKWCPIYGYRKGWIIEPEEAEIVRMIFDLCLNGTAMNEICRILNEGKRNQGRKAPWSSSTVNLVLHNEKYAGDLHMQKTFISDPINKKEINNRDSIIPQYYVRDHHRAIVSHETFDTAQKVLVMKDGVRGIRQYPFYGLLKCPLCGLNMVRFKRAKKAYWTCGGQGDACIRRERTNCIPYAVQERAITIALKKAGYPLEHAPLKALVATLTFPKWDWIHLKVIPAQADMQPVLLPLKYRQPADSPFPVFSKQKSEHIIAGQKQMVSVISANGIEIRPGCGRYTKNQVDALQRRVNSLVILPPRAYEQDIPRVDPQKKRQ